MDANAGCWKSSIGGAGQTVTGDNSALNEQLWPDYQAAIDGAWAELLNRGPVTAIGGQPVLGTPCAVTTPPWVEYSGTVVNMVKGALQIETLPSGPAIDPRTGLPVRYIQSASFQNEFGAACFLGQWRLSTYVAAIDGDYYQFLVCQNRYRIELVPASGPAESTATLISIEPGTSTQLLARIYDQNNRPVPNVGVELKLEAVNQTGGHHHGDDTAVARTGTLDSNAGSAIVADNGKTLTGNTGTNGLPFDYNAPAVSGDININAKCAGGKSCTQGGARRVWVGIKGLEPIVPASDPASGPLYVLIGQDGYHPNNHYLTPASIARLQQLAALYRQRFPNDLPLHLNDASLERGGLFDIYWQNPNMGTNRTIWWTPPHREHRRGTVIDVRANKAAGAVPNNPGVRSWFETMITNLPGSFLLESQGTSNEHYHIRLMGVAQ